MSLFTPWQMVPQAVNWGKHIYKGVFKTKQSKTKIYQQQNFMLSPNGVVALANKYEETSWLESEHEIRCTLEIQSEV